MSSGKAGKGWLGSKRKVLCGYCNCESRYDNLPRHIKSNHGTDLPLKYKVIQAKESILSLLVKKSSENDDNGENNNEDNDNEEVDEEEEIVFSTEDSGDTHTDFQEYEQGDKTLKDSAVKRKLDEYESDSDAPPTRLIILRRNCMLLKRGFFARLMRDSVAWSTP